MCEAFYMLLIRYKTCDVKLIWKMFFYFADLNLKILRDDSSCPGACSVIKWMKGCFDALDKKYVSFG